MQSRDWHSYVGLELGEHALLGVPGAPADEGGLLEHIDEHAEDVQLHVLLPLLEAGDDGGHDHLVELLEEIGPGDDNGVDALGSGPAHLPAHVVVIAVVLVVAGLLFLVVVLTALLLLFLIRDRIVVGVPLDELEGLGQDFVDEGPHLGRASQHERLKRLESVLLELVVRLEALVVQVLDEQPDDALALEELAQAVAHRTAGMEGKGSSQMCLALASSLLVHDCPKGFALQNEIKK